MWMVADAGTDEVSAVFDPIADVGGVAVGEFVPFGGDTVSCTGIVSALQTPRAGVSVGREGAGGDIVPATRGEIRILETFGEEERA